MPSAHCHQKTCNQSGLCAIESFCKQICRPNRGKANCCRDNVVLPKASAKKPNTDRFQIKEQSLAAIASLKEGQEMSLENIVDIQAICSFIRKKATRHFPDQIKAE